MRSAAEQHTSVPALLFGLTYVVAVVIILYPLSFGPIVRLYGFTPKVKTMYMPLYSLGCQSEMFGNFYDSYLHAWGVSTP